MHITDALPEDHEALTRLTKASKAYWGFDMEIMEQWSDELTITQTYIEEHFVYKLLVENVLVGYYSYFEKGSKLVKLDNLFIQPEYIRQGYGTLLIKDFLKRVSEKYNEVTLNAEPLSTDFYANFGFKIVGQNPSAIEGRFLQIMTKIL